MLDARRLIATLVTMLLVVAWTALGVGVALTVVFPERGLSVSGTTALSGTTASAR